MDDAFARAAEALQAMAAQDLPFQPDFIPLEPAREVPACVAVDGSHAVLADAGPVWVVAVRAQAVHWRSEGGATSDPVIPVEPDIHVVQADDAPSYLDRLYTRHGLEPPRVHGAEAFAEAIRELQEMQAALDAMRPGAAAMVLIDGALENLARPARPLAARLEERAAATGARLVGVAKSSRLSTDGVALVPGLMRDAPPGAWRVAVPGYQRAWVARLHPASAHAFRVDAAGDAFPELAALCRDAVYTGYPYPLALVHNTVAITGGERARLRGRLEDALLRKGTDAAALVADFHEVLDRNVP